MKIALVHVKFTYASKLSYLDDWLDAFISRPELEVDLINVATEDSVLVRQIQDKIEKVPYIIIHHSVFGDSLQYIQRYVQAFKYRRGKMLCFVGNEVNLPILGMKPKLTLLKQIKPQIIATQLLQAAGEWLYADCTSTVLSIPHALNPKFFPLKKLMRKDWLTWVHVLIVIPPISEMMSVTDFSSILLIQFQINSICDAMWILVLGLIERGGPLF
ncbi:hypothetical protein B1F79_00660 [Coxiella-like endosymbiont of Rhipicephalus sanguineus]|uniref:hypothetical protein n=1 Tax=Coxiella-like endosymbiont of Rhipicephalus sanguineus TaxID=1955402 RepID=UPI00203B28EC|nr:hypothetical protein [Coxiella-like endosymbiont of Rhipicephalus sanguineus]MBT8506276.1 hypothetical protein [Coxiella-like endosymbiont of Rhipicephalus sanguineus]